MLKTSRPVDCFMKMGNSYFINEKLKKKKSIVLNSIKKADLAFSFQKYIFNMDRTTP